MRSGARFVSQPRRLVEVLVDFAIICASFLAAYLLFRSTARAPRSSARSSSRALPVLLARATSPSSPFGIYRRVWRFAAPRDLLAIAAAALVSALVALGVRRR